MFRYSRFSSAFPSEEDAIYRDEVPKTIGTYAASASFWDTTALSPALRQERAWLPKIEMRLNALRIAR